VRANFLLAYGHCSTPENVQLHVDRAFGEARIADELAAPDHCTLVADDPREGLVAVAQLAFASRTPACVASAARRRLLPPQRVRSRGSGDVLRGRRREGRLGHVPRALSDLATRR
jgi:hypothetical protein